MMLFNLIINKLEAELKHIGTLDESGRDFGGRRNYRIGGKEP